MLDFIRAYRLMAIFLIMGGGITTGGIYTGSESIIVTGFAFIIAAGVGIYMMKGTSDVAKSLHERFNEQNVILREHREILTKQTDLQHEQLDMQHEQLDMQHKQLEILQGMATSQEEVVSTLKNMQSTLTNIEKNLT